MQFKSKKSIPRKQKRLDEAEEIELLESWIEFGKPASGSNPLSLEPLDKNALIGRISGDAFSRYAGCTRFDQLPLSQKTKDGLRESKYIEMTDVQRASLPHSLSGRDILGAAKTGSGKTLAFVIPVLETLYRLRWGPEDGVGSIIISPTRELASQLFEVLKSVGKHHNFSGGLLIGGRMDVATEKAHVNNLNILVCTPGRLLQHMDETIDFDCSQLQVLVLDEADRILDVGFKTDLNAIISQIPNRRQTFLFSATQTKSIRDLARLSLKDPEYLSVHEESVTATPTRLQQTAMIVPLEQKLDMLWSFIKAHLNSKILVFLSSCKQVRFVFESFKKLRPGIPLKCLHGKMKQEARMGIYSQFCERRSVLFSTDVASRGLDFNKAVDWVVQVDCPEDVASYIHRVGRTARYNAIGRSVLFLMPTEMKMLEKLKAAKVPIEFIKANTKRVQAVSGLLAALLVKYREMQPLAHRVFITYLRSIEKRKDKEAFDMELLRKRDNPEYKRCIIVELASSLVEGAKEDLISIIYDFVRHIFQITDEINHREAYHTLTRILKEHDWFYSSYVLMKRLQGQAVLEADIVRLKCLLVDIRGRIEGEIGSFPYHKTSNLPALPGAYVMNPCNMQCDNQVYCLDPRLEDKSGEDAIINVQGFNSCDFQKLQCMANANYETKELSG